MLGLLTPTIRLTQVLGQGAFGVVYKGLIEGIERVVAVKILNHTAAANQEYVRRFFNEAKATNRIRHNGIVQITETGQAEDGRLYLVMEYLEGESLSSRLNQGALNLSKAILFGAQIANALHHAHHYKIVHRDLKPDNIMIVTDFDVIGGERIKVLDFGIARIEPNIPIAQPEANTHQQTFSNVIMGTPAYMAPEQWRGARYTDNRTDIYALGVILYQMVAGRVPFAAQSNHELMMFHVKSEPLPLGQLVPQVPARLSALVQRMLAKDSAARPLAVEVWQELQALVDVEAVRYPGLSDSQTERLDGKPMPLRLSGPPVRAGLSEAAWGTRAKRTWRFTALGVAVVAAGTLAYAGGRSSALSRTARSVDAGLAAVRIDTAPSGQSLEIYDQATGRLLGTTPFEIRLPIDAQRELRCSAKKAGRNPILFAIRPSSDVQVVLQTEDKKLEVPAESPTKREPSYDPFPR